MRIVLSKHALEKFAFLDRHGWKLTKTVIKQTINKPKWRGKSRFGQETAMSLADDSHIVRVILNRESDIIRVITFHIARRGKYESTL